MNPDRLALCRSQSLASPLGHCSEMLERLQQQQQQQPRVDVKHNHLFMHSFMNVTTYSSHLAPTPQQVNRLPAHLTMLGLPCRQTWTLPLFARAGRQGLEWEKPLEMDRAGTRKILVGCRRGLLKVIQHAARLLHVPEKRRQLESSVHEGQPAVAVST